MRSQRIARLEIYPVQVDADAGALTVADKLTVTVRFSNPEATAALEERRRLSLRASRLRSNARCSTTMRRATRRAATSVSAAAAPMWTPPQPGYKVLVTATGIYQLTRASLATAGLPVDQLDPRTLRMFSEGQEIAIRVTGETDGRLDSGDVLLFYGQPADTRYTDTNVYWLTYGGTAGKRMAGRAANSAGSVAASFLATVKKEENSVYDSDLPKLPGYDHWFGQLIQAIGPGKASSVNVFVAAPQIAAGSLTASLDVALGGVTTGPHKIRIYVNPAANPAAVLEGSFEGATVGAFSVSFPQTYLSGTANNVIKIEVVNEYAGRAADLVRVDWVRLGYQRKYVADNDQLIFGGDAVGPQRYQVEGFTSNDTDLYDITDPGNPVVLTPGVSTRKLYLPMVQRSTAAAGAAASGLAAAGMDTYTLAFGDNQTAPRRYIALALPRRQGPLSVYLDRASIFRPRALALITSSSRTLISSQRSIRSPTCGQGKESASAVIDVQDVYDEFGGGLMSAEAIRDFVAYAYANWAKPAPSSILLVGDGTYDFRGYRSSVPTYLPPYLDMVDPDAGETATDNRFVAVTKSGGSYDMLPDLDIGRLPANSPAETSAMVSKIVAYEKLAPDPWTKQVTFVADDLEGGGGNFYAYSDGIADGVTIYKGAEVKILPAPYVASKVYLGQTCDTANPRRPLSAARNSSTRSTPGL